MKQPKKRYDVFISYRRDGGEETAKHLRDALTERGYNVFLDVESLRNGPFNEALYQVIDNSKDFILILPEHGLDRCSNENDWVRLEIERAKAANKNIVPVMLKGFTFPEELPESIDFIRYQNAPPAFEITFFDAFVDKLQTFLISKRRPLWKRVLTISAAVLLLAAICYGIFFVVNTYPLTTKDKNKVSDLITYMAGNLKQVDLAGNNYVKELNRAEQYVEQKTTDSEGSLKYELTNCCESLREFRANLTDLPDQLRQDLINDRHFVLGDLDAIKPTMYAMIDGYIDNLEYIRDFVISENNLRSETHIGYLQMLKGMSELDAEIMFYALNETLLSVTNESALDTLKNKLLPEMSFIYAKRLDLTNDEKALQGKEEAVFLQYEKLIEDYEEIVQREDDYIDPEETLRLYDFLISYRESRGMDASDLIARRDKFEENVKLLEEEKKGLAELDQKLQQLKEEAYEKFKPLDDDDLNTLWGKGKRFLTLEMPEAAGECFQLYAEKSTGDDRTIGKAAKRFTEVCTALGIKGGVVVCLYEDGLPHQAVEIGDIIYEVDGSAVCNYKEYTANVAEEGVTPVKIIRFKSVGYDIVDSVIDKSLGRIGLLGLNDEGTD